MKPLLLLVPFISLVLGSRQSDTCQCRDVICPNNGRDACDCLNRAADECARQRRNPACPPPGRLDCNLPIPGQASPRPSQNGPYSPNPSSGWRPDADGGGVIYSTYTSVIPYTTTITKTLPGFGWPNPVTSFSYGIRTTTITLLRPPPSAPARPPPRSPERPPPPPPPPPTQTTPYNSRPPPTSTIQPSFVTVTNPYPPPNSPLQVPSATIQPPWSVPPKPPTGWNPTAAPPSPITQSSLPGTSERPRPWRPPASDGPSWTPIPNPNIPNNSPPTGVNPLPNPNEPANPIPPAAQPTASPSTSGGAAQCGPGKPRCSDGTYCDPQPLCSIGEDCDGVCLPIVQTKNLNFTQSYSFRRDYWQNLIDDGQYVVYRYSL